MKCVTPMWYLRPRGTMEDGSHYSGKVISRERARQLLENNHNDIRERQKRFDLDNNMEIMQIPCGNCWACQLNYSAEWAQRCMLEAQQHECNWWITLTYDDDHLPIATQINLGEIELFPPDDGSWNEGTLYPRHVTLFLKKLRKYFSEKGHTGIKYLYCGEYGEKTHRPHYHMILFNCPLDPKEFYAPFVDKTFFKAHWKSHEIEKFWNHGMIDLTELEWNNAAYTCRYCMKKLMLQGSAEEKNWYYAEQGKEREFIRMSRRPGIGMTYYEQHKDHIYKTDSMYAFTINGVINLKPPKAFDRKLEKENPELFNMIKESRKQCGKRNMDMLNSLNDQTDLQRMIMENEKLKTKANMLPREAI